MPIRVLTGILDEIVHIRLDFRQWSVHRWDSITLSLRAHTVTPFCAKVIIGIACCTAHVLAFQIAAENENLALREFRDLIRGKSLVNLLHM